MLKGMVLHQHGSRLSTLSFQRTFQFVWCVRMFKVPSHQLPPPITSTSNGQPTQPTPRDRIIAMTIRAMIDPAARCGFNPRLYLSSRQRYPAAPLLQGQQHSSQLLLDSSAPFQLRLLRLPKPRKTRWRRRGAEPRRSGDGTRRSTKNETKRAGNRDDQRN